AREHLGRPLPNAVLLGAFSALTGVVSMDAVAKAIGVKFKGSVADANELAARRAWDLVEERTAEVARA
ncbi:MAG: 2-oxoacid:acceptor oxidoreductase family protein, partial [Solirubrobacterales bacterium]